MAVTNVTLEYSIDLSSNNNFVQVPAVQGDGNEVRYVKLYLYANGVEYEIGDDVLAYVMGTKSDNKDIFNSCVIDGNTVLVELTQQMLASSGRGYYQIMLLNSDTNTAIKTFPFTVVVTEATVNISDLESSDEWQALIDALSDAEHTYEEVKTYCDEKAAEALASQEAAATSETNAATSESNAATSEANAATSESNAATSETNAATSASNAATSESNALQSETNAATSATQAAESATSAAASASAAATSETNALESANNALDIYNSIVSGLSSFSVSEGHLYWNPEAS